jgi:phosphinothricin acetyltransferase
MIPHPPESDGKREVGMKASIRVATLADAPALADIYAPYVRDTAISFEETPPSPAEFARRIKAVLERYPYLVFDRGGAVAGYAYASAHAERAAYRWSVDVAVYVAASQHGQGIARALYAELLAILTRQGFHVAFAGIALPNDKSVGLHQALGFERVGVYPEVGFKLGAWRDVGWWRRGLSSGAAPQEAIPFPQLGRG